MKLQKFLDGFVQLEKVEDSEIYGYHPFHVYFRDKEEKGNCAVIFNDGTAGVVDVYRIVKNLRRKHKPSKMFIAIDFPAKMEMKHDFVAIFVIKNNEVAISALPYDKNTGQRFAPILKSFTLDVILSNFKRMIA